MSYSQVPFPFQVHTLDTLVAQNVIITRAIATAGSYAGSTAGPVCHTPTCHRCSAFLRWTHYRSCMSFSHMPLLLRCLHCRPCMPYYHVPLLVQVYSMDAILVPLLKRVLTLEALQVLPVVLPRSVAAAGHPRPVSDVWKRLQVKWLLLVEALAVQQNC